MGASQANSYSHQELRLPNQISQDIRTAGFDGDDVIDMQMKIGSLSNLKRRLSSIESSEDSLFTEDLIQPGDLAYRA